jgi:predicted extracellular nuclease
MTKIRIATFNVENLFTRFKFKGKRKKQPNGKYKYVPYTEVVKEGWDVNDTKFKSFAPEERKITAKAIKKTKAHIVGFQEVEGMDTLKRFVSKYLSRQKYKYKIVIDGNDPRLIDVGLISKYPFDYIRTHQFIRTESNRSYVFSRDCLEVGVKIDDKVLPIYVNHLKSLLGGRSNTMNRRKVQAEEIVKILTAKFGADPGKKEWVVLGDFNDYLPSSGLKPLMGKKWAVNVIERLPQADRWTHFYKGKKEYKQLDYILLSKKLANKNTGKPKIVRGGMPKRAEKCKVDRFEGVGKDNPKASDHCPVVMEIDF